MNAHNDLPPNIFEEWFHSLSETESSISHTLLALSGLFETMLQEAAENGSSGTDISYAEHEIAATLSTLSELQNLLLRKSQFCSTVAPRGTRSRVMDLQADREHHLDLAKSVQKVRSSLDVVPHDWGRVYPLIQRMSEYYQQKNRVLEDGRPTIYQSSSPWVAKRLRISTRA